MPAIALPDGATIHYADKRAKSSHYPPLVLIHGAGASRLEWPAGLRRLPGARVIALDLPGHGRAGGPGRQDIRLYAGDVVALLDALGIRRSILVGHSMGGGVAQHVALTQPARVAGLALFGTGAKLPVGSELLRQALDAPEQAQDWIVEASWSAAVPEEMKAISRQRFRDVSPDALYGDLLACQAFDTRARLPEIAVPTLVLAAVEDRILPVKFSETLAANMPNATLQLIERAGHMFPLEQAQVVVDMVRNWLQEQVS